MSGSELKLVNGDRFVILQTNQTVCKNNSYKQIIVWYLNKIEIVVGGAQIKL